MCPITIDLLNDITSLAPPSPINLHRIKPKVAMPHPGNFTSPDWYYRKCWRKMQPLSNKWCHYVFPVNSSREWLHQFSYVTSQIYWLIKKFLRFLVLSIFYDKKNHWSGSCYFGHSYTLSNDTTLPTVFFIYFVSVNQQLSFFISGTSTANTQNVHKI